MKTKTLTLKQIAEQIDHHQITGIDMDKITSHSPDITVKDSYEIQQHWEQCALKRGDLKIGWKMGLTSVAKQRSVGVNEPIYGRLTNSMEVHSNTLSLKGLIHPRVEPEIAFVIKEELKGDQLTARDVWKATEFIMPAVEVIDSRYKNFSFTLVDVVADNASSSRFFLSDQAFSPFHTPLDKLEVNMYRNGEKVQSGVGSAVLGHPVKSVIELAKMLHHVGLAIQPGMVILTGGITEAVNVYDGDELKVTFDSLGEINFDVKKEKED
ncbi:2-oxo-3-hexenedioate decarboxylase [Bacillus pakistanensis]|uniref:2-oxo-3-hexenedioate decarboxylase n=1 Tax=Rossellomorea pakistanensis TaxID=992288 RepID=A0ABS2N7J2_9BACI|nr:fumarylacetoacetate hydrolase family protein [Bacillus pakistanensis]MBM7583784.1 2-oxo-3-hexenedioate decarboxylase [Bacillus pakistanensis]